MNIPLKHIRALTLLSGGLDSQLAVYVLKDQGIDVHGVVFDNPFSEIESAERAAQKLGIPLHVRNYAGDIISLLGKSKHGFGSCMNPCIDCHALMLRRAGELMEEMGFDFLSTGEVLNERPMSQNRRSLEIVAKESGYADLILRPLSAKLLSETKPEREGWVDRSRLLSIEGRSRKQQLSLARHYGMTDIPTPAGGCKLTEPNFCRRLKDIQEHEGLDGGVRSIYLLRLGRHLRLNEKQKIIIGRDEHENMMLENLAELYDLIISTDDFPGPTGLITSPEISEEEVRISGEICAHYSDCPKDRNVMVTIISSRGIRRMEVMPASSETIEKLRI